MNEGKSGLEHIVMKTGEWIAIDIHTEKKKLQIRDYNKPSLPCSMYLVMLPVLLIAFLISDPKTSSKYAW